MDTDSSDADRRTVDELMRDTEPNTPQSTPAPTATSYGIIGIAAALLAAVVGLLLYL